MFCCSDPQCLEHRQFLSFDVQFLLHLHHPCGVGAREVGEDVPCDTITRTQKLPRTSPTAVSATEAAHTCTTAAAAAITTDTCTTAAAAAITTDTCTTAAAAAITTGPSASALALWEMHPLYTSMKLPLTMGVCESEGKLLGRVDVQQCSY
jgi:hypothetical protein